MKFSTIKMFSNLGKTKVAPVPTETKQQRSKSVDLGHGSLISMPEIAQPQFVPVAMPHDEEEHLVVRDLEPVWSYQDPDAKGKTMRFEEYNQAILEDSFHKGNESMTIQDANFQYSYVTIHLTCNPKMRRRKSDSFMSEQRRRKQARISQCNSKNELELGVNVHRTIVPVWRFSYGKRWIRFDNTNQVRLELSINRSKTLDLIDMAFPHDTLSLTFKGAPDSDVIGTMEIKRAHDEKEVLEGEEEEEAEGKADGPTPIFANMQATHKLDWNYTHEMAKPVKKEGGLFEMLLDMSSESTIHTFLWPQAVEQA
ncbi:hypothetical protein NQZ79_g997 [Umbelopsis isabellina]|nr:hypothetical protein NQZ79_g997 [Umbelopsis isabellina]